MTDLDVEEVLKRMTVAEKCNIVAGGDFSHTIAIKRLGIPALRMSDGPNTVRGTQFFNSTPTVCLPAGPALAATWDVQLMEELGQLLGDECIAKGAHVMLGPCINIPRTPLGGRNQEALSEDPMLSGLLAGYICRGLESKGIIATLKHFVCSDQEQGCFSMNCIVTQRALREMYLWPFMRALAVGKPGAIMAAYNKINDRHVTEDAHLLTNVLRDEWGFQGLVMSDWHGLYATTIPLCAGLDLEMPGPAKWRGSKLQHALLANRLPMRHLDRAVRAVLKTIKSAARSGMPPEAEEQTLDRPQDRVLLRRAAAQSVVLLRSDERTLPLDCKRPLAVIGPNARFSAYRGGRIAHLRPYYTVSPWEALQERSQAPLQFEQGVYNHKERPLLGHQLRTASGRLGFDMYIYTEPPDVPGRRLVDHREFLNSCGYFFNYEHPDRIDGENWYVDIEGDLTALRDGPYDFGVSVQGTASLYVDGELVIDNTHNQRFGDGFFRAGTVEEVGTLDLRKGQTYHVRVTWAGAHTSELIKNSPLTFHPGGIRLGGCERLDIDNSIQAAADLARTSEQVVVFAGLMGDWENEGSDRANMDLPPRTDELITAVLDANPSAVICISAGSPVCMPWASKSKNLMFVWYGGNETGNAIAEVLYGNMVPSGKLPISLPIALKDNPAYLYTRAERKRILYGDDVYVGYRYYDALDKEVLFPFGHGLSYTKFALSDLQVSMTSQDENGAVNISCKVTNTGKYEGAEVVQVYIQPHAPSVNRPPKELKAFQRATIPIGQAREVQFPPLPLKYALTFWDEAEERWLCEKGEYTVLVGTSSRGHFLEAPLLLEDSFWWSGL